jgi:uncharacterized cupin superfamily protein
MPPLVVEHHKSGERITVLESAAATNGAYVRFEIDVPPGFHSIPMHKHPLQVERATIVQGRAGAMIDGKSHAFEAGHEMVIRPGMPHRWWNAGEESLRMIAQMEPAMHFIEFIQKIYASANAHGSDQPALFDGVYLLHKYRNEYRLQDIPAPVQRLVFPVIRVLGHVLGKYRHYE